MNLMPHTHDDHLTQVTTIVAGIAALWLGASWLLGWFPFSAGGSTSAPSQSTSAISQSLLDSLTPPKGAKPAPISESLLKSLTPPKGAKPTPIPQSVLNSLTPPKK